MQIFNKGFLKNFSTAKEQKLKIKPQLRQIDSEGLTKYGNSTPSMKRDIFKKKVTTSCKIDYNSKFHALKCARLPGRGFWSVLGWYAQRRRTFRVERNTDFRRRAMLLNARISGILAVT